MLRLGQSLSPLPPAPITPLEISFFVWVGFCREGRARKVLGPGNGLVNSKHCSVKWE